MTPAAAVLLVGMSRPDSDLVASAGCECFALPDTGTIASGRRPSMVLVDEAPASRTEGKIFRDLKADPRVAGSTLVLVASSATSPELIESSWAAGLDDCILRPLQREQIRDRLDAIGAPPAVVPAAVRARRGPWTVGLVGRDPVFRAALAELFEHAGLHLVVGKDEESSEALFARAGALDLLLIVADIGAGGGVALVSSNLRGVRSASPGQACPVVVVSQRAAGFDAFAGAGLTVIDRKVPMHAILQQVNALLKRPPQDLRAESRVPFFCPVEFREGGGTQTGAWCSGYSFNVSSGGIFLRTLVPRRPGSAVELRIRLTTTREDLAVTGVVAWANPFRGDRVRSYPVGMGVQFLGAISKKLAQLIELCRLTGGAG